MVIKSVSVHLSQQTLLDVVNSYNYPSSIQQQQQQQQEKKRKTGTTPVTPTSNVFPTLPINDDTMTLEEMSQELSLLNVQEQLIFACSNGSDEISSEMLSQLISSSQQHQKLRIDRVIEKRTGATLMHLCAFRNKTKCIEFLLFQRISVDIHDSIQATPLMYAAASNSLEVAALLLSNKANVNARDVYGKSALAGALKNRYYKMVELLTTHQSIDIHLKGKRGNTYLHTAAEEGDLYAVQYLMQHCKASPQRRNGAEENVLYHSIHHPAIVEHICKNTEKNILYKMVINQNINGQSVIHECCQAGVLDSLLIIMKHLDLSDSVLSQLYNHFNVPDRNGDTPLLQAVKNNRVDIVRFLCQCKQVKVNVADSENNTALYYAAKNQDIISMISSVGGSLKPDHQMNDEKSLRFFRCCQSMSTLLAVILSSVAIACIISIAGMNIIFIMF
jgi:ankyrin repeat protein